MRTKNSKCKWRKQKTNKLRRRNLMSKVKNLRIVEYRHLKDQIRDILINQKMRCIFDLNDLRKS